MMYQLRLTRDLERLEMRVETTKKERTEKKLTWNLVPYSVHSVPLACVGSLSSWFLRISCWRIWNAGQFSLFSFYIHVHDPVGNATARHCAVSIENKKQIISTRIFLLFVESYCPFYEHTELRCHRMVFHFLLLILRMEFESSAVWCLVTVLKCAWRKSFSRKIIDKHTLNTRMNLSTASRKRIFVCFDFAGIPFL